MREIEITYTNVELEEVIVELACYIKDGFHLRGANWSWSPENTYTIELVKH